MKYIYKNDKLRCQITHIKDVAKIRLRLQIKKCWPIGWVSYSNFVDITLQKVPGDTWNAFPRKFHYSHGGHLEIWDQDVFDLPERVEELFTEYLAAIDKKKQANKRIEELI